jgi:hypothetical protein
MSINSRFSDPDLSTLELHTHDGICYVDKVTMCTYSTVFRKIITGDKKNNVIHMNGFVRSDVCDWLQMFHDTPELIKRKHIKNIDVFIMLAIKYDMPIMINKGIEVFRNMNICPLEALVVLTKLPGIESIQKLILVRILVHYHGLRPSSKEQHTIAKLNPAYLLDRM